MREMIWALMIVGCSTSRVSVEVDAYDNSTAGTSLPLVGATVAFQDLDGSSTTATTDADGHVSGTVEPGGTVWIATATSATANTLRAYSDVQIEGTLVFGQFVPAYPTIATMTVTGTPPTPEQIQLYTDCGSQVGAMQIQLDDRCTQSAVDILAVGFMQADPQNIYDVYAHLIAQHVQNGGTIAIPDTAWQPIETVTVQIADLVGAMVQSAGAFPAIANDFGFSQQGVATDDMTFTVGVPLVGKNLHIFVPFQRGDDFQQLDATVPVSDSAVLDMFILGTAWTETQGTSYTADDVSGRFVPTASITDYQWSEASVQNTLEVIGAPVDGSGTIVMPRLPDVWADLQPADDAAIAENIRDVRISGAGFDTSGFAAKVVAEQSDLSYLPAFLPDGFFGSIAVDGAPQ